MHTDRSKSGIVVVAQGGGPNAVDTGLQPGDIIRALAHTPLQSVSQLRETLRTFKSGDPVVVQVERDGNCNISHLRWSELRIGRLVSLEARSRRHEAALRDFFQRGSKRFRLERMMICG